MTARTEWAFLVDRRAAKYATRIARFGSKALAARRAQLGCVIPTHSITWSKRRTMLDRDDEDDAPCGVTQLDDIPMEGEESDLGEIREEIRGEEDYTSEDEDLVADLRASFPHKRNLHLHRGTETVRCGRTRSKRS